MALRTSILTARAAPVYTLHGVCCHWVDIVILSDVAAELSRLVRACLRVWVPGGRPPAEAH